MARQPWSNSTFVRTALPMFGFVLFAWYGLSGLMESKLKIRVSKQLHAGSTSHVQGGTRALDAACRRPYTTSGCFLLPLTGVSTTTRPVDALGYTAAGAAQVVVSCWCAPHALLQSP